MHFPLLCQLLWISTLTGVNLSCLAKLELRWSIASKCHIGQISFRSTRGYEGIEHEIMGKGGDF